MAIETVLTGASVDANNNVKTILPLVAAQMGGLRTFAENDSGTMTGTALLASSEVSQDYRQRVGVDTVLMTDAFNGGGQAINNWNYLSATTTCTQTGAGYIQFNATGSASGQGAYLRSFQVFPYVGSAPLSFEFTGGVFTSALATNEAFAAGMGNPTIAGTLPTDGVYFRLTNAGLFGVAAYNGVTTETGVLMASTPLGTYSKFIITVGEKQVHFWVDDILAGTISVPNGQPSMAGSASVFMQRICTGAVSSTSIIRVADITVLLTDANTSRSWENGQCGMGLRSDIYRSGGLDVKTGIWGNNARPIAVALSNSVPAFLGLSGRVAWLPTLAVGTDGILTALGQPAPSASNTSRNLVIFGVTITSYVSVALTGGAVIAEYALMVGHTAVSLATADATSFAPTTTHSPRYIPLGVEVFPATSAIGTRGAAGAITNYFAAPIVVRPGEYVAVAVTNTGTVTTAGAITTLISIDAYWE